MISNRIKLATQLALLGSIGVDILGISLSFDNDILQLNVFCHEVLDEEQVDALEAATTEIYAAGIDGVEDVVLIIHTDVGETIPRFGEFVFLRLGVGLHS